MISKLLKLLFIMMVVITLTGCWDYVGINEMTTVSGIAIDKDEQNNKLKLTFETISLMESSKEETIAVRIVESTGDTMLDAIRNAKKRIMYKLYLSATKVVVINEKLAKEDGIQDILNAILGDAEVRETIKVVISQEDTASEILTTPSLDNPIKGYELREIIIRDNQLTSSTKRSRLYNVFNALESEGVNLVLPVLHNTLNENKLITEVNGISFFKGDKLRGFITPEDTKYYLFITNSVDGGVLTIKTGDSSMDNISLEIVNSNTNTNYSFNQEQLTVDLKIKTDVYLHDSETRFKPPNDNEIKKIEKKAEQKIVENVERLINDIKKDYKLDIFNFGNLVYKSNPKLWYKLKGNWENIFLNMDFNVKSQVVIKNSAFLK